MDIGEILIEWYKRNGRSLPWRETRDPYKIWISEIILQQTRVVQGLDYFYRFIDRFPTVHSLAEAQEDEVMKYWQGLGYYSRARNLHEAAKEIMLRWNGEFPQDFQQLLSLKGIGEYTASAICSFAWDQPYAVVDGNVYRILSRLFGVEIPIDTSLGKKEFFKLAQLLLNRNSPSVYNQAIMDFGALQCVPKAPNCLSCPLQGYCTAFSSGKVEVLPVKKGKKSIKPRYFNYLNISCNGVNLMHKRVDKDIWQNLYEYPLIESDKKMDFVELQQSDPYKRLMAGAKEIRVKKIIEMPKHILSHQVIYTCFYKLEVSSFTAEMQKYLQVSDADLDNYPVSRLIEFYHDLV